MHPGRLSAAFDHDILRAFPAPESMKSCPNCNNTYPTDYTHCPRDLTPLVETGSWSEGKVVREKYRILARLGVGGMATVYKAEHLHFHELRALKVINPEMSGDQKFITRFKQEALIMRRLQHPNAVHIDDIDTAEDGRPFIVMEYIEGRPLSEIIQERGAMPAGRVCAVIKQVAAALDAAHRLGIVHRDIKPANIVLLQTPEGEQGKVLDFGIAKMKEEQLEDSQARQASLTGTGFLIGTAAYMSPEQAQGKRGNQLDARSDLYSLGVVMYQMLTAELPLKADSDVGLLMAHISTPPADIRTLRPDLPEAFANLVMKCLAKQPDSRPASARELMSELERVSSAIPVQSTEYVQAASATTLLASTDSAAPTEILMPSVGLSATRAGVTRSVVDAGKTMPSPAPAPATPPARRQVGHWKYLAPAGALLAGAAVWLAIRSSKPPIPSPTPTPTATPASTTVSIETPTPVATPVLIPSEKRTQATKHVSTPASTPRPHSTPEPTASLSSKNAMKAYEKGNFEEALNLFKKAANANDAQAMYYVAQMYELGQGTAVDYPQAQQWYEKSVDAKYSPAMLALGEMCEEGRGITKDYHCALQLYQEAREARNVNALVRLGSMYERGRGVQKDYQQALKLYQQGVEADDGEAMFRLGYLYAKGFGVQKDEKQAADWYEKAKARGIDTSKFLKKLDKDKN